MSVDDRRRYDFQLIAIGMIDPPERVMREEMDDVALEALAQNIKRNGILQPLGVVPVDGRFRISWGHRRFIAAQLAGEVDVPCRVLFDRDVREDEFKYVENTFREDVNPMAEATWLLELLEQKHAGDLDKLCASLNLKASTVNGRLDLLRGWPIVQEALRAGKIRLGVARELNRMSDESWMTYRLKEAIDQGATERVVRDWRIRDEQTLTVQRTTGTGEISSTPPADDVPYGTVDTCVLCMLPDDPRDMTYVKAHKDCLHRLLRAVRAEERRAAEARA